MACNCSGMYYIPCLPLQLNTEWYTKLFTMRCAKDIPVYPSPKAVHTNGANRPIACAMRVPVGPGLLRWWHGFGARATAAEGGQRTCQRFLTAPCAAASAVMLSTLRTVAEGAKMCTGAAAPMSTGPMVTPWLLVVLSTL